MFSHIFLGVNDFNRAVDFYTPILACLGLSLRFCDPSRPWAAWQMPEQPRPLFIIGRPYDQSPASVGNGTMVAFAAPSRSSVDQAYNLALANGAVAEGAPGLRTHYHEHYYGAYLRDPEGHKLCIVCHHNPEPG